VKSLLCSSTLKDNYFLLLFCVQLLQVKKAKEVAASLREGELKPMLEAVQTIENIGERMQRKMKKQREQHFYSQQQQQHLSSNRDTTAVHSTKKKEEEDEATTITTTIQ
jgi:hypothetical protein